MSVVHAAGIHVRHAVTRALATANQSLLEARWRVLSARATTDARGLVISADVTIRILDSKTDAGAGVVNADGEHPLMARVPGRPGRWMDVFPVTWDRWERHADGHPPAGVDPWCPRTDVTLEEAMSYARSVGKRLPEAEDIRAAWGTDRHPWGREKDARAGLDAPPRFGRLPEVGMFPPTASGFFDLGAWLHQWTVEGMLLGGLPGLVPAGPGAEPCGFRCVQEV